MKIFKHICRFILALVLALSLVGSMFPNQAYAAVTPILSVENKSVKAGEKFTIAVSLENATSVYGGNFTLQYNDDLLNVDSYTFGSVLSGHTKNCNLNYQSAGNLIRFTFSGASALSYSGTLVTLSFTAKESVSGSATLQFNAYKMYDENGSSITSTASGSTITIASEPIVSPTISVADKAVTVNETFSVPVVISNSENVYGGNFTLKYDSSLLEINSYSFGSIMSEYTKNCNLDYQSAGNLIRFTFSGASALDMDGVLITFNFTAKAEGTAMLEFNAYKMYDENGGAIATTATNGEVMVVNVSPSSVSIYSKPVKTSYYIGDTLNTYGLNLSVNYSDGSSKVISNGFSVNGFDSATAGVKHITVTYEGLTDTFTVTVNRPSVIFTCSNNLSVEVGYCGNIYQASYPSGLAIDWISSDTGVATVSNGVVTAKGAGKAIITAKYLYNGVEYSSDCYVNVVTSQRTLSSIEICSEPKTEYYIGDTIDLNGLDVKLIYSDGTEEMATEYVVDGFDSTIAGTKELTVIYGEFTDTFTITVKTPSITISPKSISIELGETGNLGITTMPSGQSFTTTSSNIRVANVWYGLVSTYKTGTTTITAKFTYNGREYIDTCSVTVVEPV